MILGYKDKESFFDEGNQFTTGRRPIYIDELELDNSLKQSVFDFIISSLSIRGINANTRFALVNGWVNSTHIIRDCESESVGKVIATKACYDVNEI